MSDPKKDSSADGALTEAQSSILDRFASIQAEMECLVRETVRTRETVSKRARGVNDHR